jgi:hypothetical protein
MWQSWIENVHYSGELGWCKSLRGRAFAHSIDNRGITQWTCSLEAAKFNLKHTSPIIDQYVSTSARSYINQIYIRYISDHIYIYIYTPKYKVCMLSIACQAWVELTRIWPWPAHMVALCNTDHHFRNKYVYCTNRMQRSRDRTLEA